MTRLFAGTPFDRPPTCDRCGRLESDCSCPPAAEPKAYQPPEKQTARIGVEKRKQGRLVTAVRGLAAESNDLPTLLTKLKNACGAGGTLDGDVLEIQGDHAARVQAFLTSLGYKTRR